MKKFIWIGAFALVGAAGAVAWSVSSQTDPDDGANPAIASSAPDSAQPAKNADFKIGDRLQQATSAKEVSPITASEQIVYRELLWDDLMPSDWDPMAPFKGMKLEKLKDGDPRAMDALNKAREYWKNAPVESKLNGIAIKIPGFVVSLEREGDDLKEFLLVPFFGGCIHVPPPPSNQIIHVNSAKAVQGIRTMDAVWVSGVLEVNRSETGMGVAGYALAADKIEIYKPPAATR